MSSFQQQNYKTCKETEAWLIKRKKKKAIEIASKRNQTSDLTDGFFFQISHCKCFQIGIHPNGNSGMKSTIIDLIICERV